MSWARRSRWPPCRPTGAYPQSVTAADLNGNGLPDLMVAKYGPNTVPVLLNTTAPGATTMSFATQRGAAP